MGIRFGNPWLLLILAVLLPLMVWMALRLALLTRFRRLLIITMRVLIITLLVLTLARIQRIHSSDTLDVLFVLDGSESVPEAQKREALAFLRKELDKMTERDRAGVLVFGRSAVIEEIPRPRLKIQKLLSEPDRTGTNVGEALRLAMAVLTGENKKRIVLLSDGNENTGSALEAAESARAHQVPVDVVPLLYQYENDVIVESVVVDSRVSVDEPFDIKLFVRGDQASAARLNVFRDNELISSQEVQLEAAKKNAFVLTSQVAKSGFTTYRVQMDAPGDRNLANNQGFAFTFAGGPPRVLFVDGNPPEENKLVPALQNEKIQVVYGDSEDLPDDLGSLQSFDTVILSNVGAGDLGEARMKALEQAVHEFGLGLIMIGGENSFGAGGYQDTPVEQALPVNMEITHKKVVPRGALVVILHTCEIPEGNYWAREVALAALGTMSRYDLMGLLYYGVPSAAGGGPPFSTGEQWLFTLQEVGNKTRQRSLIQQCVPGDMPSMANTINMAYGALAACSASVKHIVLITDGDPQPPDPTLVSKISQSRITMSCVGISPHRPGDVKILESLATACGGSFYNVTNPNNLPQIFIKEASLVRKPLIREEPFRPRQKSYSPILSGISGSEIPTLTGHVCASPKSLADVPIVSDKDDPILAHWQYGVGKAVAFTSDAQARWAADWLGWDKFSKFWTQLVRWSLRGQLSQNLQMQTSIEEGTGRVAIDAVDVKGNFINFLDFQGSMIGPDMERSPLAFKQTGPGRYEASFPVKESGSYLVSARCDEGEGGTGMITGGLAMPYSPEHKNPRSNEAVLRQIAAVTNGRYVEPGTSINAFDHRLPSGSRPEPVWPRTLALAILLLPVDVFFRRVMIDWRDVRRASDVVFGWLIAQIQWVFARRAPEREEAISALFEAKERAREREAEIKAPAEEFLAALERAKQRADGSTLKEAAEAAAGGGKPVVVRKSEKQEERAKPKAEAEGFTDRLLDAKRRARQKRT